MGCFCAEFRENGPRYNDTTLYVVGINSLIQGGGIMGMKFVKLHLSHFIQNHASIEKNDPYKQNDPS